MLEFRDRDIQLGDIWVSEKGVEIEIVCLNYNKIHPIMGIVLNSRSCRFYKSGGRCAHGIDNLVRKVRDGVRDTDDPVYLF